MYKSHQEELLKCTELNGSSCFNTSILEADFTNTDFLTVHYLSSHLTNGDKVLLVSLHHPFSHLSAIADKAGTNLLSHFKLGNLKVIEGLRLMREAASLSANCKELEQHPFSFIYGQKTLKNLFLLIKQLVTEWQCNNSEFTIIIDKLCTLINFNINTCEFKRFIAYCNSLLVSNDEQGVDNLQRKCGCLIISSSACSTDVHYEDLKHLLTNYFDVTVSLEGLSTGRSSKVDGRMRVIRWPVLKRIDPCSVELFHYKLSEKGVNLFAPGMASSLLSE